MMPETKEKDTTTPFANGGRALAQAQNIANKAWARLKHSYSLEELKATFEEALRELNKITH